MAENCTTDNTKLFGRAVLLEVADGCGDTVPAEAEFKLLMPGTSKTFDMSPNTTTSSADDTKGWVENIVTSNDLTLSFEGEVRVNDRSDQYGVYKFIKYYVTEVNNSRQPTLWVRMSFGQLQIQGYMVITSLSNDGGTDDIVTLSTEFKVADGATVSVTDITEEETP
ncbi:phage tail tube protein [Entomohabitans teleogrylli]|uniref:phage tail tube protein n=1 Tax=Entomohabitans teleogrylli TaxID=1384589 RepID=UPI00073D5B0C|nr:phage tail tube protein [Entomohabitans teleogrylli]